MNLNNLLELRQESVTRNGVYENTFHFPALGNKTHALFSELKNKLERCICSPENPNNLASEIEFFGALEGQEYKIRMKRVNIPVQFTPAYIHHVSVLTPSDKKDSLSPLILDILKKYESDYKATEKTAIDLMRQTNDFEGCEFVSGD